MTINAKSNEPAPAPPTISSNPTTLRKWLERAGGRVGIWLIVCPIRSVSLPTARGFGVFLGKVLYATFGKLRRNALKNLKLVYPDLPDAQRVGMAKAVFDHFGKVAAEFLQLPKLSRETVDSMVTVVGEENLAAALAMNKGVLLVTGHFGNWEFMARWLATHGYPLNVVARDARDPETTKLMAEVREGIGANVLYRGSSARAVLKCLRANEIVALLPDQNAADIFVPFLGVKTGTIDGPAIIHLKTGSPLLFSWCVRTSSDTFNIEFESPIVFPSSKDKTADIAKVMTLINDRLSLQIHKNPTQWQWLHDRWKATPGIFPDSEWHAHELKTPTNKIKQELEDSNDPSRR